MKRVVLTGAESTGKTTLARRLAAAYDTVWVPEYLRRFVEAKGALPLHTDADAIARGHLAADAAHRRRARRVYFLDTDLVSACVYNRHYFGACPGWIEAASRTHHADLYLLATPDGLPWTPDPGQRESAEVRAHLHRLFEAELIRRGLPYVPLAGPLPTRFRAALTAVNGLLAHGSAVSMSESGSPQDS